MKRTTGTIISAKKQGWLKIHGRPTENGAVSPCIVRVRYAAEGKEYVRKKWIGTEYPVTAEGDTVCLAYEEDRPGKIKVVY